MRLEEIRPGVYQAVVTAHELSALLAGARMSLSFMEQDPTGVTEEARKALGAVLERFDSALARVHAAREESPPGVGGDPPAT